MHVLALACLVSYMAAPPTQGGRVGGTSPVRGAVLAAPLLPSFPSVRRLIHASGGCHLASSSKPMRPCVVSVTGKTERNLNTRRKNLAKTGLGKKLPTWRPLAGCAGRAVGRDASAAANRRSGERQTLPRYGSTPNPGRKGWGHLTSLDTSRSERVCPSVFPLSQTAYPCDRKMPCLIFLEGCISAS